MDNIENVHKFVEALDVTIDNLEDSLQPFLQKSLHELISTTVKNQDNIQTIKICNNYLYTLISVLFAYLKTIGVNTNNHPIMKELTRIKSYINRAKELENNSVSTQKNQEIHAEKAKQFLQNTLGTKSSVGGAAMTENLSTPAISSANFTGTHTKFEEEQDSDLDSKSTTPPNSYTNKTTKTGKSKSNKLSSNRIAKPKKNKNRKS